MPIPQGSTHRRRVFFLLGVLSVALLGAVRYGGLRSGSPASILDNLIADLIGAMVVLGIAHYLWPSSEVTHELRAGEIRATLKYGLSATRRRYFLRGRGGSFLAATAVKTLAAQSLETRRSIDVRAQLLDPSDASACAIYADYRRQVGQGTESGREIQLKLLSNLVSLHCSRSAGGLLSLRLFVSSSFSLFRLDISDDYVVITRESKSEPGLKVAAGTEFYDLLIEDFLLSERQARELVSGTPFSLGGLSPASVRQLLSEWALGVALTDDEILKVATMARIPRDPYA